MKFNTKLYKREYIFYDILAVLLGMDLNQIESRHWHFKRIMIIKIVLYKMKRGKMAIRQFNDWNSIVTAIIEYKFGKKNYFVIENIDELCWNIK